MADTLRKPLENALDQELRRIERYIVRVWLLLAGGGVLFALVVAAFISRRLGLTMAAMAAVVVGFFAVFDRMLATRPLGKRTPLVIIVIEGVLPWTFFAALYFTQGAAYALASWVPPLLYAAVILAWVTRLEPVAPMIVGLSGAAAFLAAYFLLVHPHLPRGAAHSILQDPPLQFSRAFTLAGAGVLGSVISRTLRRAIGRADSTARADELFGKYRLVRKIGAGSGGSVHEAVYCPEGGFERRVAIKQLHPQLVTEPSFVEGFRAEAELGARLAHPNVVTIHDFGRHDQTFFMAMEFVDGLPLSKLTSRMRAANVTFTPGVVGHIGRSVLRGLDHAQEGVRDGSGKPLHILHRDVCPQNILVSRIGEVKLTDFGIARVLGEAGETSTRTIAGHEAYMAPEQLEGRAVLGTDLFALGVVLWELVANKRLFLRENPAATLLAVLSATAPPVDPAWDPFFARALARDPAARFGSAREMLAALDAIAGARSEDAPVKLGDLVVGFSGATGTPDDSLPTRREVSLSVRDGERIP